MSLASKVSAAPSASMATRTVAEVWRLAPAGRTAADTLPVALQPARV